MTREEREQLIESIVDDLMAILHGEPESREEEQGND